MTALLTQPSAKEPLGRSAAGPPGAGDGPEEGLGGRPLGGSDTEGDGDGADTGDGVGASGAGAGARTGAGDGVGGATAGVGLAVGETVGVATGAWAMHEVAKRANNKNNLEIAAEAILLI
ncbi:hypothetical protein L2E82_18209 [Cichorium intybus]|uniref:Uncharacterized protein n=1 Tax=Cichorium intybus TaxID=13427 RepID=A0ACB9F900_CICIN|nr:hypothetical protein L2E82_18209 [Cichorium intybus]